MAPKLDVEFLGDTLPTLNYIIAPFSLIGSCLMLYFCIRKKPLTVTFKLMAALALSDLLLSVTSFPSLIFKYDIGSTMCDVEGGLTRFFFTMSIFLTTSIAVLHYKLGTLETNFNQTKFYNKTMILAVIISALFSIGGQIGGINIFLYTGAGCYQVCYPPVYRTFHEYMNFIYFNVPIYGGPIVSLIFYIMAIKRVQETINILFGEVNVEVRALLMYPGAMFLLLIPYMIFDVLLFVDNQTSIDGLVVAVFITLKSLGFVHAVVYIIQRKLYWNAQKKQRNSLLNDGSAGEREEIMAEINHESAVGVM